MSKARDIVETLRTVLVDGDVTNANFTGADLDIAKGGTGASTAGAARTALGVAIGSDVLAPDGSAANLTNLPAGGAEDFVASGTLPNGKPVILKANGQVEVVGFSPTSISQSIPAASGVQFENASATYTAVEYDPNTAGRFVVVYADGGNSDHGTAIVGNVSGTSLTFGSAVVFNAGAVTHVAISFDPNTDNKFVIAFKDNGNSQRGAVIVGTIASNSVSFGTEAVFETSVALDISVAYDPNTANKFVVAYNQYSNSGHGTAIVGTVSSNSISYGSKIVYNSAQSYFNSVSFDPNTANKLVIAYRNVEVGTARVGTVSSNSISFGTPAVFENTTGGGNHIRIAHDPNTANKFVIIHSDEGNSNYGTAIVGTVSSTSISYGSPVVFSSVTTNQQMDISFDKNTSTKFIIAYRDATSSPSRDIVIEGTLGSTSVSFGSAIVMLTSASYPAVAFDPSSFGKFVMVGKGPDSTGTARLGQIATTVQTTNLTATNFLGTATAAYTNGQTASIMLKGGISDNQTSLTVGSTYYVQTNGTFATTSNANTVLAGKAVSATSLLLNGLATPDEIPSQSGNTGKFLTTNGSAASWGTVVPAGMILLSTINMAGASTANVETTFNSTYDYYHIVGTGIKVATSLGLQCQLKVNGSYNTQWNYRYHIIRMRSNSSSITNSVSNAEILIPIDAMMGTNTDADAVCHFSMDVFNPTDTVANHMVSFDTLHSEASHMSRFSGMGGFNPNTGALTGVRFKVASTSFSAGTLKLYGVVK